jgi:hypothetical protein
MYRWRPSAEMIFRKIITLGQSATSVRARHCPRYLGQLALGLARIDFFTAGRLPPASREARRGRAIFRRLGRRLSVKGANLCRISASFPRSWEICNRAAFPIYSRKSFFASLSLLCPGRGTNLLSAIVVYPFASFYLFPSHLRPITGRTA